MKNYEFVTDETDRASQAVTHFLDKEVEDWDFWQDWTVENFDEWEDGETRITVRFNNDNVRVDFKFCNYRQSELSRKWYGDLFVYMGSDHFEHITPHSATSRYFWVSMLMSKETGYSY